MTAENLAIENYACPHCRAVFRTAFARCPLDGNVLQPLVGDPLAGTSFADRYIIEECVGEGGMGRVYRARHQRMSRRFAVKVLFGDHAADKKMQARLAREAEAASRLSHPNVISVLDFGETDQGLLYLVMDYVEGPTLARLIEQQAPFDRERIHKLTRDMARGLSHAHKRNLIHRDFKADNVIISEDGGEETAKIVDFGIAVLNEPTQSRKLTTEGMVLGTPAVMAPEQAVGETVDHRTDLFSLGVVLYEMLSGRLPFDGSPLEIARQNLATKPPSVAERVPGLRVDPDLEALSIALMAKRPDDRPATAKVVLRALSRMEGETSREFDRSEGHFMQQVGVADPVSGEQASGEDAGSSIDLMETMPISRPHSTQAQAQAHATQASGPVAAPVGYTEMISAQPRKGNNKLVITLLVILVLATGAVAALLVAGGAGQREGNGAADDSINSVANQSDVKAAGDDPEAYGAVKADAGPGENSAATDVSGAGAPASASDDGLAVDAGADESPSTDRKRTSTDERERAQRARVRGEKRAARKERDDRRAAEARAREKLAQEKAAREKAAREKAAREAREKADASLAVKVVSVAKFNSEFRAVGNLVNRAKNLDAAAAKSAANLYSRVAAKFATAQANDAVRAQAFRWLRSARSKASVVIRANQKNDD